MSVALGQHMDSLVVDDRATAFKAVDWLKRNRWGSLWHAWGTNGASNPLVGASANALLVGKRMDSLVNL